MSKVKLEVVAKEHKEVLKGDKTGLPVVGLEHLIPKQIKLENWDVDVDNTFTKMFRKGNVLFGRRRAYLKKAAYATVDGICSGDITVIEVIPGKIYPELLPFIIQNDDLFDYAVGKSAGSLSPRVKWEHLKNYEFTLPDDIVKQKEIADLLWSMIETRDAYVNMQKAADELVKSQFTEMFGHVFTEETPWEKVTFDKAITDATKRGTKIRKDVYLPAGTFPIYDQGQDCIAGYWDDPEGLYEDVPAIIFGDHTRILKYVDQPFFLGADGVKLLKTKRDDLDYLFLLYELRAANIPNTGYNRHFKLLKELSISIPPMELQEQFAIFVRQSEKSKFNLQRSIDELDATLKKILEDNFKVKEG